MGHRIMNSDLHNVYSPSDLRDEILTGMAIAFLASAYADFAENEDNEDFDPNYDYPRPGPGQDWLDYLPKIPGNAWALAGQLWGDIERLNRERFPGGMYGIAEQIRKQEGKKRIDWHDFGYYLAAQSMGEGVSWSDDHRPHNLEIPYSEVSQFSFNPSAYSDHE